MGRLAYAVQSCSNRNQLVASLFEYTVSICRQHRGTEWKLFIIFNYFLENSLFSLEQVTDLNHKTVFLKICVPLWVTLLYLFFCYRYFSNFLQSVYYIKHQIDILSQLLLVDILYNDTALSYFTEVSHIIFYPVNWFTAVMIPVTVLMLDSRVEFWWSWSSFKLLESNQEPHL